MKLFLALILSLLTLGPASAREYEVLEGRASVIDGDTVEIHGQRIRLHGIDAPESRQLCTTPQGEDWRCGQRAALALADRIDGATLRCEPRTTDRYKRLIAVCFARGEDINKWMVAQGWALAYRQYSKDYVPVEALARSARLNIWSGEFQAPWNWRKERRKPRS